MRKRAGRAGELSTGAFISLKCLRLAPVLCAAGAATDKRLSRAHRDRASLGHGGDLSRGQVSMTKDCINNNTKKKEEQEAEEDMEKCPK